MYNYGPSVARGTRFSDLSPVLTGTLGAPSSHTLPHPSLCPLRPGSVRGRRGDVGSWCRVLPTFSYLDLSLPVPVTHPSLFSSPSPLDDDPSIHTIPASSGSPNRTSHRNHWDPSHQTLYPSPRSVWCHPVPCHRPSPPTHTFTGRPRASRSALALRP